MDRVEVQCHQPFYWWRRRLRIIRSPETTTDGRFWTIAEIICASLTLITLTFGIGLVIVSCFISVNSWIVGWPLQIFLAGAVGYGTNFLAVQMLFKPRKPVMFIPMRWIWKQGLLPAKQKEMAIILGDEIATRLLTPETMVDELVRLVDLTLTDHNLTKQLQSLILPFIQQQLPVFFKRFMPELLESLKVGIRENLPVAKMKDILMDICEEWFDNDKNQIYLSNFLLGFLQKNTKPLIKIIKSSVKRYQKSGSLRSYAIKAGIASNIINWKDFDNALKAQLMKPKSQRVAANIISNFRNNISKFLKSVLTTEWLNELKNDAGSATFQSIQRVIDNALVPHLIHTIDSGDFRDYVHEEFVPSIKPKILEWLKGGYLVTLMKQFDVKSRISEAAGELDITELEDMSNRVAAFHLGAIQVLGYLIGVIAGILMVVINIAGGS